MGRSKRKLGNVEEYDIPDPAVAVTTPTTTQMHSEYASGQAARHWSISTPFQLDSEFTAVQTGSPDVSESQPEPTAMDWSQANNDTSAHIEAEVELAEMKDCELEALGLKQFLKTGTKSGTLSDSEKTNQTQGFTQSVSGFISSLNSILTNVEPSTALLDTIHRCLCRTNSRP
jgi:hypothetical protein